MHLVVGTPMYGGMCSAYYTSSLIKLKEAMIENGHKLTPIFLGNESLIQRARDKLVHLFLETDASHLLFCDADQEFRANDVAKMLKADKDILTGIVPMKNINWETAFEAMKKNKSNIEDYTGIFNTIFLKDEKIVDVNTPIKILHGGSGFMLIKREVFEKLIPHVNYYTNGGHILGESKIYNFFEVLNKDNELLSEDYSFCEKYRELGGEIYAAPWVEVGHFGTYCFRGKFSENLNL